MVLAEAVPGDLMELAESLVRQIQAVEAVEAVEHPPLHQRQMAVQAVLAWSSSPTLARKCFLAVQLQLLVVTPSTHLIQVVL